MESNNNYTCAYIIKDPKTYLNAEEAWYKQSGEKKEKYLFVIIPKGDPNNVVDVLKEIIDVEKWEHIIWFYSFSNYNPPKIKRKKRKSTFFKSLLNFREYIFNKIDVIRLNKLAGKYGPVDIVYSGHKNTQEHLAASLNPKDNYLMDSGMTLSKIGKSGYIDFRSKYMSTKVKRLFYYLIRFKVLDRRKTKLFTIYADQANTKHPVVKNEQNYKLKLIREKQVGNKVVFISSPIYSMTEGVTIKSYIQYLRSIFQKFEIEHSNLIYVPNPIKESQDDIKTIKNEIGCTVDDRLIPVEIKIAKYQKLPILCLSPCSTALANIAEISQGKFKTIAAWHPEFDCFKFLIDWKNNVVKNPKATVEFSVVKSAPSLFNLNTSKCKQKPIYNNFKDWSVESRDQRKATNITQNN